MAITGTVIGARYVGIWHHGTTLVLCWQWQVALVAAKEQIAVIKVAPVKSPFFHM
jgi:hypothetical protein